MEGHGIIAAVLEVDIKTKNIYSWFAPVHLAAAA